MSVRSRISSYHGVPRYSGRSRGGIEDGASKVASLERRVGVYEVGSRGGVWTEACNDQARVDFEERAQVLA